MTMQLEIVLEFKRILILLIPWDTLFLLLDLVKIFPLSNFHDLADIHALGKCIDNFVSTEMEDLIHGFLLEMKRSK